MKSKKVNFYNSNNGQADNFINDEKIKKLKEKERIKRIKQARKKEDEEFLADLDVAIQMTNRNKIKQEADARKKEFREERKRKKRISLIRTITSIVVLLGLTVGGIIFAMVSPIFNINEIEVVNNSNVTSEEIISLSGIKKDQNIFRLLKSQAINRIKENPCIENATISRKLPNKIQIDVEERKARFSISFMGTYALINSQGYILKISESNNDLPIINGIKTKEEEIVPGNRLSIEDLDKLGDVLKIMKTMDENQLGDKVSSIDISDKTEYILYLDKELKTIYFGDASNISNKILYILAIMEENKGIDGYIYINGDLNNKFQPYFRTKV